MSWLDMLTLTLAALSGLECVTGRIAAMDWRRHRRRLMVGYWLASGVCFLTAGLLWQGIDEGLLDLAVWGIALHLALTWGAWRDGPPAAALQYGDMPGLTVAASIISQRDDSRLD